MSDAAANGRTVEVMVGSGAMAVPERRDPTAATKPLQYLTPGLPQPPAWDGEGAFRNAYDVSVHVMRCVELIATTIASLPFRAGVDPESRADYDTSAPLARLLGPAPGGPAPRLSARRFWTYQIKQYLVTGRFGAEIERGGRFGVTALWPLVASFLRPIPTTSGADWFAGFEYGRPGDPRPKRLKPDQVLYHWKPSGTDFREPESPLKAARLPIQVAVMLDRYSWAFLQNDARPAQVVVTQPFATEEDYEAFANQFIAEHAGVWNAGKTAFVEANDDGTDPKGQIHIETLGLTQKDAQMLESAKAAAETICTALGVPMSLLQSADRTFSNAAEEKRTFLQNTILPLVADLEDAVNTQLAPMVGREWGWFDLTGVPELAAPPKVDPTAAALLVGDRLITPNEARAELGFGPATGGDQFIDPPALAEPAATRAPTVVVNNAPAAEADERARRGGRARPSWESIDRKARLIEQSWEASLRDLFERQRKVTLDRLKGSRYSKRVEAAVREGTPDPAQLGGVFDQAYWRAQTSTAAEDLYRRAMLLGLDRVSDHAGISFDLESPFVKQFILDRANNLAGHTTAVTYSKVQQSMVDGVAAGEGIDDIARRVEAVFSEAKGARAELIARTEVISASNGAVHEVAAALPDDVASGKEWISATDERTRESHAAADGQIVGRNATFDVGGAALRYPGDPAADVDEVANCRCAIALVTPEGMPS